MKFIKTVISVSHVAFLFFLFFSHFLCNAQDSQATVYFYHRGGFGRNVVGYNINDGEKVIGAIRGNGVVKYRTTTGLHTFNAKTSGEAAFKVILEGGKTYFIECGVAFDLIPVRPSFHLATEKTALTAIRKIDTLENRDKSLFVVIKKGPKEDTIRALHNLYRRKRVGGTVRGSVFGGLAGATLLNINDYQSTSVTVHSGSGGSQSVPIDDSPPPGNYIALGAFTILSITGFFQISNHTHDRIEALVKDYDGGRPLPEKIKKKLKPKDFKGQD
ncbi:MAG TPA: hypothetical protein VL728_18480 [Cyclobacteriaceae bacterium]|nr:hypothetical protein [Cyclobacteriaceae bacterium]